jgi:hypothetical protein
VRYHPLLPFAFLNPNRSSPRISSVTSSSSSKYPRYFFCSICVETEYAMVAAFCSLWLIFHLAEDIPLCSSIILK